MAEIKKEIEEEDMTAKKRNIYEELSKPFPSEAVQRTDGTETRKGYDTTGYGYQYEVNRFNEVCGLSDWGYEYRIVKEIEGKYQTGKPNWEVCVELSIWIKEKENIRRCVGGHLAASYSDALKGAITNAFKKTAAFWGVGRQAYEGSIDEDNVKRAEGEMDRVSVKTQTSASEETLADIERELSLYDEVIKARVKKQIEGIAQEDAEQILSHLRDPNESLRKHKVEKEKAYRMDKTTTTGKEVVKRKNIEWTKQQLLGLKLCGDDKLGFKGSHTLTKAEKTTFQTQIKDTSLKTGTVIDDLKYMIDRRKKIEDILTDNEMYRGKKIDAEILKWILIEITTDAEIKNLADKVDWNADAESILTFLNEQKAFLNKQKEGKKSIFPD